MGGKDVAVGRLPGHQGEDRERPEEERQDRQQEGFRGREAGLQANLRLDEGRAAGTQAAQGQGLRGGEEGHRTLQAREGPLQEVRERKEEGRDYVARAPGRGVFCALSNGGLVRPLRGSNLMYASV